MQGNNYGLLVKTIKKIPKITFSTGSFENEALENEDPKISKNEEPETRKRRPLNLENEAPKTGNHCRFNKCNFMSYMTQSESGGGSGCVGTSKGPQNPSQGFITNCFTETGYPVLILLSVSLNLIHLTLICIFSVHIHVYVDCRSTREQ